MAGGAAGLLARSARAAGLYPLATSALILDVARAGEALVAVGERGIVLRSTDRGASWTQMPTPVDVMLTAVAFTGAQRGVAVGHDGVVLTTADAGQTWIKVREDAEVETPLFDIHFDDAARGFAVGAFGLLLVTSDGGATWTESRLSADEPHIYALARRGEALWAAGEAGTLLMSEDNGATWATRESPYVGSFFGLMALKDGALLTFGLRGNAYRSDDAGETWTALATGTDATLQGGAETAAGVVIVGLGGTILSSRDGRAFSVTSLPNREALSGAVAIDDNKVAIFGEGGVRAWTGAA